MTLVRREDCVGRARRFTARRLRGDMSDGALGEALVVVSELVTHVYRHGAGALELKLLLDDSLLRVDVVDHDTGRMPKIEGRGDQAGRWGLQIVAAFAIAWGTVEGTSHVWAELPLS